MIQSKIVSKEIRPNVYLVEKNTENLLYAPFKGIVAYGTKVLWAKKLIRFFPDIHLIPEVIPLPTTVTLDIVHQCPLYCVYCSVDSGRDDSILDLEIAYRSIDFIFQNARKLKISSVGVVFGGGGEPSLAWSVLSNSIIYTWKLAQDFSIEPQILVATGGIISKTRVKWLAKNTTHIALSFDGPETIQNTHRPLIGGRKSFEYVLRTAELLGEINANFSIRAAISELNSNLKDLAKFFIRFRPRLLNFQPVVSCGRCYFTGWKGLEPDRFVKEFLEAREISKSEKIPLVFPGTRIERLIPEMCHAYNGTGFVVTNRGLISACERVLSFEDGLADLFIYGRYQNHDFQRNEEKMRVLKTFKVDSIPYCVNCFCRWHCCGGCLNDHLSQPAIGGDPFSVRTNEMCYITREIAWELLKEESLNLKRR